MWAGRGWRGASPPAPKTGIAGARQLNPPIIDAVSNLRRIFPTSHSKLPPAMRRLVGLAAIVLIGCGPRAAANSPSPRPNATASASVSARVSATVDQDPILGPAGLTLRQEIGAVMMVGFKGSLTSAVLNDWKLRQFG